MNKQRFLAELRRLLVFMTEEDRELCIRYYTELFEDAGEEGEAELLEELGTPTKLAISMSRGYEPGSAAEQYEAMRVQREQKKAEAEAEVMPDIPSFEDVPEFRLPDEYEPVAVPPETDDATGDEYDPDDDFEYDPDDDFEAYIPEERPEIVRPMPLGVGIPLFTLGMIAVGLPLAALALLCLAVLLAPGCAAGFAAGLAAVGAMWCMTYMADALLLFGLAFLILAVALLILWGGVWCCVKIIGLYVRFVRWFAYSVMGQQEA